MRYEDAPVPSCLVDLVEQTRRRLHASDFCARPRVGPADFTRHSPLGLPVVSLLVLQKTTRSVQRHWHEFFEQLAAFPPVAPATPGGWTQARAQLRHPAFIELNQTGALPLAYAPAQRPGRAARLRPGRK